MSGAILTVAWREDDETLKDSFDNIEHILEDDALGLFASKAALEVCKLPSPFKVVEAWDSAFYDGFVLPPLEGAGKFPYVMAFSNDPREGGGDFDGWMGDTPYELHTVLAISKQTNATVELYFIGLTNWADAKELSELFVWNDVGDYSLNGHIFYSGSKYYDHFSFV